jgi:chemotaxis protein CheD
MEVFLNPGDFHFGAAPERIGTLLGSCVAITLWHPRRHIGGMCHILLPGRSRRPTQALDGRYADEAIELFQQQVAAADAKPKEFQAKLFGGGNMFAGTAAEGMELGPRNIEAARAGLKHIGVTVMAEHIGGIGHRKLYLDLATGDVWLSFPQGRDAQSKKAAA